MIRSGSVESDRLLAKRRLQRMHVKHAYDRDKRTIASLRTRMETLEWRYVDIIVELSALIMKAEESTKPSLHAVQLIEQIKALVTLTEQLTNENELLLCAHTSFSNLRQRLQHIVATNTMLYHSHPFPLSELERVIKKASAHVNRFACVPTTAILGGNTLGWTDQRRVIDRQLTFSLSKCFHFSSFQLWQRTWTLLCSPDKYAQIYSPSVVPVLQLLHQINDSTLLYYTKLNAPALPAPLQSVYLLHREQNEHGFVIFARSVDHAQAQFDTDQLNEIVDDVRTGGGPRPTWTSELFVWIIFHTLEVDKCTMQLSGSCHKAWTLEVLMIVLQWQIHVVGHERLLKGSK